MSTSKNKKDIKVRLDRIEKIFQKYSLKIVNVEKIGANTIFSNRPIPKNNKN